jgi:hypothetical protein
MPGRSIDCFWCDIAFSIGLAGFNGGETKPQSGTRQRDLVAGPRQGATHVSTHPRYKSTPRVAVRVVPLYEAEIVAEVEIRTKDVLTVKVALVAPAGTVTLDGTVAAPLLLERKT